NSAADNVTQTTADNKPAKKTVNKIEPQPAEDDAIEVAPRTSRRMRRAVDRKARTKTRWRKLG
ncbi:MAG: hypothetical protein K2F66_08260, partial [Duncaniella sp.]|nr:hypothetical protein [Duncaniella sp.]